MRLKIWVPAGVIVGLAAAGVAFALSGGAEADPAAPSVTTAEVTRGSLSTVVSISGTLTYRAQSDGSPYSVINQARGIYTQLPANGDQVDCGDVLYRVDDNPVLLLCGTVPAYRNLGIGATGQDVRQLNENLHALGYDAEAGIDPGSRAFTATTRQALEQLQKTRGLGVTGELGIDDAVFLPDAVRIADVSGRLGGSAQPNADVLHATSDTLVVRVDLEPWQQGDVKVGDRAQITLPGNVSVSGKIERLATVARAPAGEDNNPTAATIPAFLSLDDPSTAGGLDQAPVSVDITTTGVDDVLSVPVTALVGKAGGGYAVEVVRNGDRRDLVPVTLGLFDTEAGRVQVDGELQEGDPVVVPSS
ncbi:MAG TPA: efflux RND transporter periplasmic adaptor subunit [Sporichthya sp.]|nr:efflux RND transporter periplasmic adaptor subunit [Sporichthya sp.]